MGGNSMFTVVKHTFTDAERMFRIGECMFSIGKHRLSRHTEGFLSRGGLNDVWDEKNRSPDTEAKLKITIFRKKTSRGRVN